MKLFFPWELVCPPVIPGSSQRICSTKQYLGSAVSVFSVLYNRHRPELRLDCYDALNLVGQTSASRKKFTDSFALSFPMSSMSMSYDFKIVIHRIHRMK